MSNVFKSIGAVLTAPYFALNVVLFKTISAALTPTLPQPKPADITDFDAPTAEEGRPIPVVFGTVKITGANVLWYGGLFTKKITKKGGKK